MGCTFPIDLSIFKDKIIVITFILIVILSGVLIMMIKSDGPVSQPLPPGHGHNNTKVITTWTLTSGGDNDCLKYGSVFGGSGPNGSTHGSCHMCNCTSVETRDI